MLSLFLVLAIAPAVMKYSKDLRGADMENRTLAHYPKAPESTVMLQVVTLSLFMFGMRCVLEWKITRLVYQRFSAVMMCTKSRRMGNEGTKWALHLNFWCSTMSYLQIMSILVVKCSKISLELFRESLPDPSLKGKQNCKGELRDAAKKNLTWNLNFP